METEPPTDRMRVIELERGLSMREILRDLAGRGLDQPAMARELGVSVATINAWLKRVGARRRYEIPADEPVPVG